MNADQPSRTPDVSSPWLHPAIQTGVEVVLDLSANYVIAGTVQESNAAYITLTDADVHDLRDSKSSRELYVLETRRLGVRVNRKQVMVRWDEVVAISRLEDVVI